MALIQRSDKVAFYDVATVLTRMKGFTALSQAKNPKEYTRQYVDETFEESDVVGYSPSMPYAFDQYSDNTVHADIADITDGEKLGSNAIRDIILVDFATVGVPIDSFVARKRSFAVIPDTEGDSMDAYTYSGNFKTKSKVIVGTVTTTDEWETCVFVAD